MNQKVTGTVSTIPMGLLKGALVGIGATVAGAALLSWLIIRETIRETGIGYCAMAVLILASFLGAWAAMEKVKRKAAITAVLSGTVYYAVLLGANALFLKGEYQGLGVTALLVLAGAGTALLMKMKPEKKRHSQVRKKRHR